MRPNIHNKSKIKVTNTNTNQETQLKQQHKSQWTKQHTSIEARHTRIYTHLYNEALALTQSNKIIHEQSIRKTKVTKQTILLRNGSFALFVGLVPRSVGFWVGCSILWMIGCLIAGLLGQLSFAFQGGAFCCSNRFLVYDSVLASWSFGLVVLFAINMWSAQQWCRCAMP